VKVAGATLIAAAWASVACVTADARVMSESDAVRSAALQELIYGTDRSFVCLSVHPGVVSGRRSSGSVRAGRSTANGSFFGCSVPPTTTKSFSARCSRSCSNPAPAPRPLPLSEIDK
jgi:hypothetical protein